MKKTLYTIGRDSSCDICLHDPSNVVSRQHAAIKIKKNGRYVIVDYSMNGTFVNGVRIQSQKEVPVTRKDVISFANVARLDWKAIPRFTSWRPWTIYSCIVLGVVLVCIAVLYMTSGGFSSSHGDGTPGMEVYFPGDSLGISRHEGRNDTPVFRRTLPGRDRKTGKKSDIEPVEDTASLPDSGYSVIDSLGALLPLLESIYESDDSTEVAEAPADTVKESVNVDAIY